MAPPLWLVKQSLQGCIIWIRGDSVAKDGLRPLDMTQYCWNGNIRLEPHGACLVAHVVHSSHCCSSFSQLLTDAHVAVTLCNSWQVRCGTRTVSLHQSLTLSA